MRIWFDVLTPKQVRFFEPMIKLLREKGSDVLATSRRYREVEQLARIVGLELNFIGERGGKEPVSQLRASLTRMQRLHPLIQEFKPDVSVSVASTDCARVSFGMRVRHIAVNDSPHSTVAAKLSVPLSFHLFTPWVVPFNSWTVFGISRGDITRYRALDPAAWLKRERGVAAHNLKVDRSKRTILVRVEESYAPYMIGKDVAWTERILERLRADFSGMNVVVLCRYDDQLRTIRERFGESFIVPERIVDGTSLIRESDVFVGMGGTMTAEAALSGVPTISAFQGELFTERYLASKGLLVKALEANRVSRLVKRYLDDKSRSSFAATAKKVLDSMEDPVERITEYLLRLDEGYGKLK